MKCFILNFCSQIKKMFAVSAFCSEYPKMFHFSNICSHLKNVHSYIICSVFYNLFTNRKNVLCFSKKIGVQFFRFLIFLFTCSNVLVYKTLFRNSRNVGIFRNLILKITFTPATNLGSLQQIVSVRYKAGSGERNTSSLHLVLFIKRCMREIPV